MRLGDGYRRWSSKTLGQLCPGNLRDGEDRVCTTDGERLKHSIEPAFEERGCPRVDQPAKVVYMRNGERKETTLTPAARK